MTALLLAIIIVFGALGIAKRIPYWISTTVVGILTVWGVFQSPDPLSRALFIGAAMIGPLLPYPLAIAFSLTVRPLLHYLRWSSKNHRTQLACEKGDPIHEAIGEQLDPHVSALLGAGFVSRGRVKLELGRQTAANEFLDRGDGREWVVLSAVTPAGKIPVIAHAMCRFEDGETLIVSNNDQPDPNPPVAGYTTIRMPSLTTALDVVNACLSLATREQHGPVVRTPLDVDLVTRSQERTKLRLDAEVRAGYLRYDPANDVYRATLKGAYRLFWVLLPPGKLILNRREREREKELLKELGLKPSPKPESSAETDLTAARKAKRERVSGIAALVAISVLFIFGPDLWAMMRVERFDLRSATVNVPSDFAVPDSFPDAVRVLERLAGAASHPLSGSKDDEPSPTRGYAISMRGDSATAYVKAAQRAFLAKGFYLFRTGEHKNGFDTDALALYPTTDPYEIMRAMDTNAANYGMLVEDVIAWFKREEARYPITFDAIGFDYAGGKLGGDVPDATDFAKRFIDFCPEVKNAGMVSAFAIGRDFKRTREIFCWWD